MNLSLVVAAAALGLAGSPHCAAMCGAPCAAASSGCGPGLRGPLAFQAGRLVSYMAGGAIAAASVASIAAFSQITPMLRPLWTLLHVAALAIGLWMLVTGAMPRWMGSIGRSLRRQPATPVAANGGWQPMRSPLRPAATGALWVAWPCGLLQSALLVAALADSPWTGAAAMGVFALTSSLGLVAGPALWMRFSRAGSAAAGEVNVWAARIAGASICAAAAWALGHGLWARLWAWCIGG